MIGPAIKWKLSTLTTVGIFPNAAPEGSAYPKIVYQVISHPRVLSLKGYSGLASPRVQVDIYGLNYADCDTIANALVKSDGSGLSDAIELPATWQGVFIAACRNIGQRDFYYAPQLGEGSGVHRISQDYHVWYKEF